MCSPRGDTPPSSAPHESGWKCARPLFLLCLFLKGTQRGKLGTQVLNVSGTRRDGVQFPQKIGGAVRAGVLLSAPPLCLSLHLRLIQDSLGVALYPGSRSHPAKTPAKPIPTPQQRPNLRWHVGKIGTNQITDFKG